MTKKHFIALAKAIAKITDEVERWQLVKEVADVCVSADKGLGFDRARFLNACMKKGKPNDTNKPT